MKKKIAILLVLVFLLEGICFCTIAYGNTPIGDGSKDIRRICIRSGSSSQIGEFPDYLIPYLYGYDMTNGIGMQLETQGVEREGAWGEYQYYVSFSLPKTGGVWYITGTLVEFNQKDSPDFGHMFHEWGIWYTFTLNNVQSLPPDGGPGSIIPPGGGGGGQNLDLQLSWENGATITNASRQATLVVAKTPSDLTLEYSLNGGSTFVPLPANRVIQFAWGAKYGTVVVRGTKGGATVEKSIGIFVQ
ncbi:MAG: hypothetical protein GX295_11745 [Syntrophomonadaceae bacterium]|nr:hypothetical protein [Syntrophomonadaceae bacterium]